MIYLEFVPPIKFGVKNKINYQINSFLRLGIKVRHFTYNENNNFVINDKIITNYTNSKNLFGKIFRIVNIIKILSKLKKITYTEKIIYIRYFGFYYWTLSFLKYLKIKNFKIIIEIPTYPYDKEIIKKNFLVRMDKKLRLNLYKYVDLIVYFGEAEKTIWGIPALKLENGIEVNSLPLKKERIKDGKINFIAVANLSNWHGYDRFIRSISNLDNNIKGKVVFHIVGEGSAWQELKDLVRKLKLEKNIIFYGVKSGKELDDIFDKCDIGVGSLGAYRKGLNEGSELKSREYCARGLPFFSGVKDLMFDNQCFKYTVENNENLFNIDYIIKWYEELTIEPKDIRKYAEENITWDIQIKKVINKIKTF